MSSEDTVMENESNTAGVERAYSIEAVADMLSISQWTVRKWITEKKIASCKLGSRRVIPASEISRILKESRV